MSLNIVIAGPRGRMGSEVVNMINKESSYEIVAFIDYEPTKLQQLSNDIPVFQDGKTCFNQVSSDILIDFTVPKASFHNTKAAILHGVYSVVGTTGMSEEQLNELQHLSNEKNIGCIIAPNFALGAILMMEFAKQAAKYFPQVEIIDKHHSLKYDSPSGTAIKTAQMIQQTKMSLSQIDSNDNKELDNARGYKYEDINIHSVRLPGYIAHHEVIFGAPGQTLTIKHDSTNRESFMDGIRIAIEQVNHLTTFTYGLESIINTD